MGKKWSLVFGVVFLVVGLLGMLGGMGVFGPDGVFMTDNVHDWVHILSGVVFLLVAFAMPSKAHVWMKIFGVVYLVVGVLGFFMNPVLGFLSVNQADNWLHLVLGVVILLVGVKCGRSGLPMVTTPTV